MERLPLTIATHRLYFMGFLEKGMEYLMVAWCLHIAIIPSKSADVASIGRAPHS